MVSWRFRVVLGLGEGDLMVVSELFDKVSDLVAFQGIKGPFQ